MSDDSKKPPFKPGKYTYTPGTIKPEDVDHDENDCVDLDDLDIEEAEDFPPGSTPIPD